MANIPFALYLLTSDSSGPSHCVKTPAGEGWVCWGRCHWHARPQAVRAGATTLVPHHRGQPHVRREQKAAPGGLSKALQTFWSLGKVLAGPTHPLGI